MRLAVVSDIHANLTALQAVTADLRAVSPDLVLHGGDLVGSGARPVEVLDHIQELGWAVDATDEELLTSYGTLKCRVVIDGHIHRPFVRRLHSIVDANSGSVSLSHDGDPRAAFAVIDGEQITIRRVEYDIEREARALVASGCPDAQWIAEMLRKGTPLPPPR